jgi:hypothetical protein
MRCFAGHDFAKPSQAYTSDDTTRSIPQMRVSFRPHNHTVYVSATEGAAVGRMGDFAGRRDERPNPRRSAGVNRLVPHRVRFDVECAQRRVLSVGASCAQAASARVADMRVARRVGIYAASAATTNSSTAIMAMVVGSRGVTP